MGEHKLGLLAVTSLTLVSLIGTGMFFGPALSAQYGGPASILLWIVLGINTIYVALLFAELTALHPKAGGIYEFAKQAYGRFPSFMIGWLMWLVTTVNSTILIIAALDFAFPGMTQTQILFAAVISLFILHAIAYVGLGASEAILDFFAFALLAFVIATIIGGAPHADMTNYDPFFTGPHILLLVGLFFILETYFGWEAASFLAEETESPEDTIPKALIIASVVSALLGTLFTGILYAILPASTHATNPGALTNVFATIFGTTGVTILRAGVFLAFIGSAAANIIAGPRLLLAMARDKLFLEHFADISPLTGTPGKAILFQGIVSGLVLFRANDYTLLLSIMVPLALLMYVPTILAVPVLRIKQPGPRPFKAPLAWIGSLLSSGFFLAALAAWAVLVDNAPTIMIFIASLIFIGLPIYLFLSTYYNPSTQLFFSDALAYPALALEFFILPKSIRKKMLSLFNDLAGKTVLEFGAGVGSMTMHLADAVTPSGKVVALEAGKSNIDLLVKRIEKAQHKHVSIIQDPHITSRLHPKVKEIDAVFSLGMLGYIQDKQKVLQEIASVMPENSPVCFMEWVDYFGIFPDPKWLKNLDTLKKEFRDAGFSVKVEKVRGALWNYLLVYGIRSKSGAPYV